MLPNEPSSIFLSPTTFCGEIALAWTRRHVRSVRARRRACPIAWRGFALFRTTARHGTWSMRTSSWNSICCCCEKQPLCCAHHIALCTSFSCPRRACDQGGARAPHRRTWSPKKLAALDNRPGTTPESAHHVPAGGSWRHQACSETLVPPSLPRPWH
jgi:hypothetical protein